MGFVQAIYSLGMLANRMNEQSKLIDIINFLQLPYPLSERDQDKVVHVIRIWLSVDDPFADTLIIKEITRIDRIEYPAIGRQEIEIKERCLYRDAVGSNVSWRFSPLYKLGKYKIGKGKKDTVEELLGSGWQTDKDSRFYKLHKTVLIDYEKSECFAEGSVKRLMNGLVNKIDKFVEFWSDKKRPYMILLGIDYNGSFLYPGEIPAFVTYFRKKLASTSAISGDKSKHAHGEPINCALCLKETANTETLDKLFKFSTFDKPNFLPGTKSSAGVEEKVYPVCRQCFTMLSAGREEMDNRFVDFSTVQGLAIYVIPEILSDHQDFFEYAAEYTKQFIKLGIRNEKYLFEALARHEQGLVYHFLFVERNQAQLVVHCLVEDVPPSHLRQLQLLWSETLGAISRFDESINRERIALDKAFRQIVAVLLSLAGKRKQDKTVMRGKALSIIAALLNGEQVQTLDIKMLMVSRFSGLFTDHEWIQPKEKDSLPGRVRLKGMLEVIDFLNRVNGGRKDEA